MGYDNGIFTDVIVISKKIPVSFLGTAIAGQKAYLSFIWRFILIRLANMILRRSQTIIVYMGFSVNSGKYSLEYSTLSDMSGIYRP